MIIGIDFDGTCTTHEFPKVGKDIGAIPILKDLVANGHKLVLFTMRSNRKNTSPTGDPDIENITGNFLDDAVNWFKDNGISLWGIQKNPDQHKWTTSPKAYCHLYIDDAALGCPLFTASHISDRPFVDWSEVRIMLKQRGILT